MNLISVRSDIFFMEAFFLITKENYKSEVTKYPQLNS